MPVERLGADEDALAVSPVRSDDVGKGARLAEVEAPALVGKSVGEIVMSVVPEEAHLAVRGIPKAPLAKLLLCSAANFWSEVVPVFCVPTWMKMGILGLAPRSRLAEKSNRPLRRRRREAYRERRQSNKAIWRAAAVYPGARSRFEAG